MTAHREVFTGLVQELTALLQQIAALRATQNIGAKLAFFDQSLELFGVKDWPSQLGASDKPIDQWHVETGEMMLELARATLRTLQGPAPGR